MTGDVDYVTYILPEDRHVFTYTTAGNQRKFQNKRSIWQSVSV